MIVAKKKSEVTQLWLYAILALLLLLVMAGASWAAWELASTCVSPTAARAWALLATALLPVAARAGYALGQSESRGKLVGIDAGIERVTKAAATAIDLRATSARAMRQARQPPVMQAPTILPPLEYVERPQLPGGDAIDL